LCPGRFPDQKLGVRFDDEHLCFVRTLGGYGIDREVARDLLEIEHELGAKARYAGASVYKRWQKTVKA
jgi:hypothetical protein